MISVVVYGRNDNYGYNLHKRAAISLNCIAEVLDGHSDEIIFVDYNTPDDYPTFPEAIRDTLTPKARRLMRILRVRPSIHSRYKEKTHLLVLEPIARNIAISRANDENRWILSTNTDIIFVRQDGISLSELAAGLEPGLYQAPRLEIPETLWEGLNRTEPRSIIETVRGWGRSLHLDEIVYGNKSILYDGPGDFQLMDREGILAINGFDERMLVGWHLDSNISKRMELRYGRISDLGHHVYAYHCDHTRQITAAHAHNNVQNDIERFVTGVTRPDIPEQCAVWGCPDDKIEEIRLSERRLIGYVEAVSKVIGPPLAEPYVASYSAQSFGKVDYDWRHVLPFLIDIFSSAPRSLRIGWFGIRRSSAEAFARILHDLEFQAPLLVPLALAEKVGLIASPLIEVDQITEIAQAADAFITDFGAPDGNPPEDLSRGSEGVIIGCLLRALMAEHARMGKGGLPTRRFVAINAINNPFESFFRSLVATAATPFSSRLRQGFALRPSKEPDDWFGGLQVSVGGERTNAGIETLPSHTNWVFHGPYRFLLPGRYALEFRIDPTKTQHFGQSSDDEILAVAEIVSRQTVLSIIPLYRSETAAGRRVIEFDVPRSIGTDATSAIEFRLRTIAPVKLVFTGAVVTRMPGHVERDTPVPLSELVGNWLPFLAVGRPGRRTGRKIVAPEEKMGHVFYGGYFDLEAACYEFTITLDLSHAPGKSVDEPLVLQVLSHGRFLWRKTFRRADLVEGAISGRFKVCASQANKGAGVEFTLSKPVGVGVDVRELTVSKLAPVSSDEADDAVIVLHEELQAPVDVPLVVASGRPELVAAARAFPALSGRYRMTVDLLLYNLSGDRSKQILFANVFANGLCCAASGFSAEQISLGPVEFEFDFTEAEDRPQFSFEIWSAGSANGEIHGLLLQRLGAAQTGSKVCEPLRPRHLEQLAYQKDDASLLRGAERQAARMAAVDAARPCPPSGSSIFDERLSKGRASDMTSALIPVPRNWLPGLQIGVAGRRANASIEACGELADFVFYGPYLQFAAGRYRLELNFDPRAVELPVGFQNGETAAVLQVVSGRWVLARVALSAEDLGREHYHVDFDVPTSIAADPHHSIQALLKTEAPLRLRLVGVSSTPLADAAPRVAPRHPLEVAERWLPFFRCGDAAIRRDGTLIAGEADAGLVLWGGYLDVPAGHYECVLSIAIGAPLNWEATSPVLTFEVLSHGRHVGFRTFTPADVVDGLVACSFDISPTTAVASPAIEIKLTKPEGIGLAVDALDWRIFETPAAVNDDAWIDVTKLMSAGPAGSNTGEGLRLAPNRSGVAASGPGIHVNPGVYELKINLSRLNQPQRGSTSALVCSVFADGACSAASLVTVPDLLLGGARLVAKLPALQSDRPKVIVEICSLGSVSGEISQVAIRRIGPLPLRGNSSLKDEFAFSGPVVLVDLLAAAGSSGGPVWVDPRTPTQRHASMKVCLAPGWYNFDLKFKCDEAGKAPVGSVQGLVELSDGDTILAVAALFEEDLIAGKKRQLICLGQDEVGSVDVTCRIIAVGEHAFEVSEFWIEFEKSKLAQKAIVAPRNLASILSVGPAGQRAQGFVRSRGNAEGHVVYGPYLHLPPGHYRVEFGLAMLGQSSRNSSSNLKADALAVEAVAAGDSFLAHKMLKSQDLNSRVDEVLEFSIEDTNGGTRNVEFRVWVARWVDVAVESVTLVLVS